MTTTLITKLLDIQKEQIKVSKDGKNPHFKSSYTTLDNLLGILLPLANSRNILIYHSITSGILITTITDIESGEVMTSDFPIYAEDPQKIGATITYAKRYNLGALFNIITEADDDANKVSGENFKKKEYPKTEADDLLDSIAIEDDIENLKTLFAKLYKMGKTEKQKAFYKSKYDNAKARIERNAPF